MKRDNIIDGLTSELEIKLSQEQDSRRRNMRIKETLLKVKQYYQEKFMQKLERMEKEK